MLPPEFHTTPGTHSEEMGWWDRVTILEDHPEGVDYWLRIQFQNGPVVENGVCGVQLTDVLRVCLARYKMLHATFPCRENSIVITKLQEALMWDEERTSRRTLQGVEGYDKPHK